MSTLTPMVNAWIFLNEDEPVVNGQPVPYSDPSSCFQTLITNNVYQSVDFLYMCFAVTLPTSSTTVPTGNGDSYTIEIGTVNPPHPGGLTNQDYMNNIIRDARANNPNIKIGMTLLWGDADTITNIFSNDQYTPQQNSDNFAANLTAYLKYYDIDGFDIDWESPISDSTPQDQIDMLVASIRASFDQQTDKHYYLTLSPAGDGTISPDAVNANFDFINLQLYFGLPREWYVQQGWNEDLMAYGAKFESDYHTAQDAYDGYKAGGYKVITQWRLNSDNFQYEQDNQVELYNLVFPS